MPQQFRLKRKSDVSIPIVGLILSLFGLVMVLSASQVIAAHQYGSQYYFFIRQIAAWTIGLIAFFYFLQVPLDKLYAQRRWYVVATLVLLVLVLLIGPRIAGVKRWIDIGAFQLQPAELAKLFLTIYLAAWLAAKGDKIQQLRQGILPFVGILVAIIGLIILEPDMGTVLVIVVIAMAMLLVARLNLFKYLLIIAGAVALFVALIYAAPYRTERLTSFLHPSAGGSASGSYHTQQSIIAIGSGGWWGLGFGQGTSKYGSLPEAYTDSIFAVVGEELGFVRASLVLLAYLFLAWRAYLIASQANSQFIQLLACGIGVAILVQALINIGGMLGVIPLTGVPLPFISYGGSSMVVSLSMLGLLTNASREVE